MDRFDTTSEFLFPRGNRSSDFSSALSSQKPFDPVEPRDGYGVGYGQLHSERGYEGCHSEPGYGGYSYSSSYDDMRKTAYEGGKLASSRLYDEYGLGKGSGSYKDSIYDLLPRDSSGLSYGVIDGSRFSNKQLDLSHHGISDVYPSQYNFSDLNKTGFDSLSKPGSTDYEPFAAVSGSHRSLFPDYSIHPFGDTSVFSRQPYFTPPVGSAGAASEYQQSSGLSRHYNSNLAGTSGALGEWRDPVRKVLENEEDGIQQAGSFLSNAQEGYAFGKAGSGSEMENGGGRDLTKEGYVFGKAGSSLEMENGGGRNLTKEGYVFGKAGSGSEMENGGGRDLTKFGKRDGEVHGQIEVDRKGRITSMPSESGIKIVNYNEGSLQTTKEKRKRQSRWEPVEENEKPAQEGPEKKKKKTRWSEEKPTGKDQNLAETLKQEDSELITLSAHLIVINRKLQTGKVVDERPDAERSPSPEPVFDNFGYRVNTREVRAREKLMKERQQIMAALSKKNPAFKRHQDSKQAKVSKKLPIPVDKYPDYNFVGLIIGPRGHTQKKMEKESGARIFIRGKGSSRESSSMVTETEDLHVLIEADTQDSVNKASGMVEKLLVPVGDWENEHKKAQLRELASMNGTLRTNDLCDVCRGRHLAKDCPLATSLKIGSSASAVDISETRPDNLSCHICKGYGHLSIHCPSNYPVSGSSLMEGPLIRGLQVTESDSWINNHKDDALLYVAGLPVSVDELFFRSLFSPFGKIVNAKVMRHPTTGVSKGYGFVKFLDMADAAQAVTLMNGYGLNGKVLQVKLRSGVEAPN